MHIRHSKWKLLGFALLCGAGFIAHGDMLCAAELRQETLKAWAAYVHATESRIGQELLSGRRFLVIDYQAPQAAAAERSALRNGAIPVARMDSLDVEGSKIEVPGGMIHHWRGSVLIPGVDLPYVLARVENPVSQEIRQEDWPCSSRSVPARS